MRISALKEIRFDAIERFSRLVGEKAQAASARRDGAHFGASKERR